MLAEDSALIAIPDLISRELFFFKTLERPVLTVPDKADSAVKSAETNKMEVLLVVLSLRVPGK